MARVDCRTTIDDFTGEDRLVRLRWPCPVPGAMPVSEVGDAVVGRGFALLHDGTAIGGHRAAPVDAGQPGLRLVRLVVGGPGARRRHARAGGVGGRGGRRPTEAMSGPLARELMVALVRAGVTATCSGADKPRYGHLDVDSNLPDVRIALGGPGPQRLHQSGAGRRPIRCTPQSSTGSWPRLAGPGCGCRPRRRWRRAGCPAPTCAHSRALPVLVIDGARREQPAARRSPRWPTISPTPRSSSTKTPAGPVGAEHFEARTVALLNRGVPSFAVDSEGTLHTALMRSCTGWPSGIWIDEPRRTAPDGSNFQLQHWTHVFDYALVCGDGDWRRAEIPTRSAQFSHPLLAVLPPASAGRLPSVGLAAAASSPPTRCNWARSRRPATRWRAAAPSRSTRRGGPAAGGNHAAPDASVAIGSRAGHGARAAAADLLEKPREAQTRIRRRCTATRSATVLARLEMPRLLDAEAAALAPEAETAQPLYARYWLHNRGPAPLGGLPAVAHLHPRRLTAEPGSEVALRLTVASDSSDAALAGTVTVVCPHGWSASTRRAAVHAVQRRASGGRRGR